jgi:hypothetical protein
MIINIKGEIETVNKKLETRGVKVPVTGAPGIFVQVVADKINDAPWEFPRVEVPQSKITYDQWRDLTKAVETGFVEYENRFTKTDVKTLDLSDGD